MVGNVKSIRCCEINDIRGLNSTQTIIATYLWYAKNRDIGVDVLICTVKFTIAYIIGKPVNELSSS